MAVERSTDGVRVGVYAVEPLTGRVVVQEDGREIAVQPFYAAPDAPYTSVIKLSAPTFAPLTVSVEDGRGKVGADSLITLV